MSNSECTECNTFVTQPAQQLLRVHEEHEEIHTLNEATTKTEHSSTTKNTDLTSASYDSNFPSLSASTNTSTKPSLWGIKSGAAAVRSGVALSLVGEHQNSATDEEATSMSTTHRQVNPSVKKPINVTELLELPASQQLQNQHLQKKEFGNKITTVDVVKRVKDKTNTNIEVSTGQKTGNTTFIIKGKHEDVKRAKRDLLDNLAVKIEKIIKVPISVRRNIIGTRGQTLQSITSKTRVRIQLPPRQENHIEERSELDYDDEEEMMDVKLEGDAKGISLAIEEIDAIVINNKTTKRHKITNIEHQYYPLISGAHNSRINQISHETGAKINVPPYFASTESTDEHSSRDAIVIFGEREAIKKASDKIEEIYEELKSNTTVVETSIPKCQHKFLIGQKGSNLQEILEKTGCSLELTPPSDPSEKVIIRGPQSQISAALQAVYDKTSSIHVKTLDISYLHKTDQPLEHAKKILKYLWNRNKLKKIESDTGIQIIVPKGPLEKAVVLEFVGKISKEVENAQTEVGKEVDNARKEVREIVEDLSPSCFAIASIEPHLHRHIIGRKGQNLQRVKDTYGVEIIVPDEKDDSPDILIVFEGKREEIPSNMKEKEAYINDVLEKAKAELVKAGQDASDFATQSLTIPVRFHRYIIGPKGSTLNGITGGIDAPVSVKFGSSRTGAAERSANAEGKRLVNVPISDDIVIIKGPTDEVDRVVNQINHVVENAKHVEIMKSYTEEFTFPAQFSAHVIGKGGAHVNRLKENLNVRIDIEGGAKGEEKKTNPSENVKVTITGVKNNVEEAKVKILDLIDKLQDATMIPLIVPAEYHRSLIGTKGRYVKRLEEKYGVQIRFPRINGECEEGTCVQNPDEVTIKGGKRGVHDAKIELLELLDYERDHDNSINFKIPAKYLPHIVGKGGSRISDIKTDTFTRIDLGQPEIPEDGSEQQVVNVVIHGTKSDICKAQEKILNIVKELEDQIIITMHIDPQHHKYLIGSGGSRIREIVSKASEMEEKSGHASIVKFPRYGDNSDEVILKGDKNLVEKVKIELERLVKEQSNLKVGMVQIPRTQYSILIGRNASQLRELQTRYNVEIQVPGSRSYHETPAAEILSDEIENSEEAVKIIGKAENIEAAKADILSRMKYTHTVNVPRKFHRAILTHVRKLRNEFNVIVDHGEVSPEKIDSQPKKLNGNVVSTKRIDDDNSQVKDEELECEIVENEVVDGDIPWNLKGEKSQVEKAELCIKELLEEAVNVTHTGYITVPQQYHRHIIGRNGATISRIRAESKCNIEVPKSQGDDIVIVTGSREGIEKARKLMNSVVERAGR
ncbi:14780_t:CDS:2 [Funneliformis geosporum]|uniref:18725_t:CDS:1 n=1 Tax=Funneliformis geosporum TaxID=1117311 RepID=A0A9W4WU69_9GLOM|nr:14780_t:CDS:2 [Funneliformis geosporum]CAI2172453.1 18725_t:CDS:2 [Funneliformis geosporum]